MIGICQRFNISRGLKRGLLSQKEYFVYFTNICSAAIVTESSFLGIQTEFTGMRHFPGLWEGTFEIMRHIFGYFFFFQVTCPDCSNLTSERSRRTRKKQPTLQQFRIATFHRTWIFASAEIQTGLNPVWTVQRRMQAKHNSRWPMLKRWTWWAVWALRVNIFSHTKCFYTRSSKNEWTSRTGFGLEFIQFSHAQEISSLAPTCVQSYMPGDGSTGNKLVARFPFWPSKQSVAALFCKVKAYLLLLVSLHWCMWFNSKKYTH